MPALPLSFACAAYDRMVPLLTGEVKPAGIDLNFIPIASPRDIFDRMAGRLEFDCYEFSSSELISQVGAGASALTAIPVFPSRMFRHGFITVNRNRIKSPKDLEGKRIGVPLYTMTAAVFIRGMLTDQNGVDFSGVEWVQGSINVAGRHGNPTVPPLLNKVNIKVNDSGKSLSELIDAGEIDAIIGTDFPRAMRTNKAIGRLFPDFPDVERDYYRSTGIYPIMHLVAIKRELYERHPFIATSLYQAFCKSKDLALARLRFPRALATMMPWTVADMEIVDSVFGDDPWPYGIERNRKTLEALVRYLVDQSLIAKPVPLERIFVPVTE
ncbi:MAG: ABC transporter substrate-binding protein [Xanthobacteraceae bacterium]